MIYELNWIELNWIELNISTYPVYYGVLYIKAIYHLSLNNDLLLYNSLYAISSKCDPSDQNQSYVAFFTFLVLYIHRKGNVSPLKWHKHYCSIMFLSKVMSKRYG